MKIRTTIAVMAAKITGHVCKLMGRQGVTWAGKVAMKSVRIFWKSFLLR